MCEISQYKPGDLIKFDAPNNLEQLITVTKRWKWV